MSIAPGGPPPESPHGSERSVGLLVDLEFESASISYRAWPWAYRSQRGVHASGRRPRRGGVQAQRAQAWRWLASPTRGARRPTIASATAFRPRSHRNLSGGNWVTRTERIQFNPPLLSNPQLSPPRKSSLPPPRNLLPRTIPHATSPPPLPRHSQSASHPPTPPYPPLACSPWTSPSPPPPEAAPASAPQTMLPSYHPRVGADRTAALKTAAAAAAAAAAAVRRAAAAVVHHASVESHPPSG